MFCILGDKMENFYRELEIIKNKWKFNKNKII